MWIIELLSIQVQLAKSPSVKCLLWFVENRDTDTIFHLLHYLFTWVIELLSVQVQLAKSPSVKCLLWFVEDRETDTIFHLYHYSVYVDN
jgi:hypothetical protein